MPFSYRIHAAHRLAVIKLEGALDGAVFLTILDELFTDAAWQPSFDALWDFCEVTELVSDRADVARLVARMRALESRVGPGRTALVAPRDVDDLMANLVFVLARTRQRERQVFHRMAEALAWLGVEATKPEEL